MRWNCPRRISLRGCLVVMTCVALCLARWTQYARIERDATLLIHGLHGDVVYEHEIQSDDNAWQLSAVTPLSSYQAWIAGWLGPSVAYHIGRVDVSANELTNEHLQQLARLPRLRAIFTHADPATRRLPSGDAFPVAGTASPSPPSPSAAATSGSRPQPITDEGLNALVETSTLEALVLAQTRVTKEGIGHLRHLPHLQMLQLESPLIDDQAIPQLAQLRTLECLMLDGTQVSAAGIARLRRELPTCWVITGGD